MKLALAFGLGVIVGALSAWEAARRWERASIAWSWAWAWLSDATYLAKQAAGWILGLAIVIAAAGALVWIAF
jgi:hypothetical protein